MTQPHYTLEHIEANRAEFEERWQWEAIERGVSASHDLLMAEHARVEENIQQLIPPNHSAVFDYVAALEEEQKILLEIDEAVQRAFRGLEQVHHKQQRQKLEDAKRPSLEEVDKHIAQGILTDDLSRYDHKTLIYIAQKANIDSAGLNTRDLLRSIRDRANFILPSATDRENEE